MVSKETFRRSERWTTVAGAAALFALNAWIVWRIFRVEFTNNFGSIEGSFIALVRYISLHWGDFSWWPIWHCGMPFQDTYVPLVHVVSAAVSTIAHLPPGRAYHFVTGLAYCLGASTLFLMAVRLGAARGAAFAGALAYSLFSPSLVLLPEFAADIGGLWFPRRLQVLTVYGEGPHLTALMLLPVAILALQQALERRTGRTFALAAAAIALVFLTNVPGSMGLALAVFCWLAAQPAGERAAAWRIAAGAAILAYGIACFGVPPSSLGTVFGNVGRMHGGFSSSLQQAPYALPVLLLAIFLLGRLLHRIPFYARVAALFSMLTGALVLTARSYRKFELLPQAGRLHLEMEMGICLLLGWLAWLVYSKSPRPARPILLAMTVVPILWQVVHYRDRARNDLKPVDVTQRSEYTSAMWLDRNLPGERVYATGSTGFWLNAFTSTPQLIGCCDQGEAMPILRDVPYLVNAGLRAGETEQAILWMQALGVQAMVINGPESNDEYKDVREPARFEGKLPVLHRERGDTIYAIPQRSRSLAHVIRQGEQPVRVNMLPYLTAIQDPARPVARLEWIRGGTARIVAPLSRGDLVSVQAAYFKGWKASIAGVPQPVSPDGIGFIVIHPECQGDCEIVLQWTHPWDFWLAAAISFMSLAAAAFLFSRVQ